MKYLYIILLTIFFIGSIKAQSTQISFERNFDIKVYRNNKESFEGSPFYNEDWIRGNVIFKNGSRSDDTKLKYSSYFNQLFFKRNGQLLVVSPSTFNGFILKLNSGNILFKKGFKSSEGKIKPELLLEVIYEGEVNLLIHHDKKIFERNSDPLKGEITKSFRSKTTNYLVDRKGEFHEVDIEEENILNALKVYKNELKQYAENEGLSFDNKSDLKKILAYYDSIPGGSE